MNNIFDNSGLELSLRSDLVKANVNNQLGGMPLLTEKSLQKAVEEMDLLVYEEGYINSLKADLVKGFNTDKTISEESFEKAKKDLGKLIKTVVLDKNGVRRIVYVARKEYKSHTEGNKAEIEATIARQKALLNNPKSPTSARKRAEEILKVEQEKLLKVKGGEKEEKAKSTEPAEKKVDYSSGLRLNLPWKQDKKTNEFKVTNSGVDFNFNSKTGDLKMIDGGDSSKYQKKVKDTDEADEIIGRLLDGGDEDGDWEPENKLKTETWSDLNKRGIEIQSGGKIMSIVGYTNGQGPDHIGMMTGLKKDESFVFSDDGEKYRITSLNGKNRYNVQQLSLLGNVKDDGLSGNFEYKEPKPKVSDRKVDKALDKLKRGGKLQKGDTIISFDLSNDLEKAHKDLSKLIKTTVMDKNGHRRTVYISRKEYESHTKSNKDEILATIKRQESLLANPKSPESAKKRAREILKVERAKLGSIDPLKKVNKEPLSQDSRFIDKNKTSDKVNEEPTGNFGHSLEDVKRALGGSRAMVRFNPDQSIGITLAVKTAEKDKKALEDAGYKLQPTGGWGENSFRISKPSEIQEKFLDKNKTSDKVKEEPLSQDSRFSDKDKKDELAKPEGKLKKKIDFSKLNIDHVSQNDRKRVDNIIERGGGSRSKEEQLARIMAKSISDPKKAQMRAIYAEDQNFHNVAEIFFERAEELNEEPTGNFGHSLEDVKRALGGSRAMVRFNPDQSIGITLAVKTAEKDKKALEDAGYKLQPTGGWGENSFRISKPSDFQEPREYDIDMNDKQLAAYTYDGKISPIPVNAHEEGGAFAKLTKKERTEATHFVATSKDLAGKTVSSKEMKELIGALNKQGFELVNSVTVGPRNFAKRNILALKKKDPKESDKEVTKDYGNPKSLSQEEYESIVNAITTSENHIRKPEPSDLDTAKIVKLDADERLLLGKLPVKEFKNNEEFINYRTIDTEKEQFYLAKIGDKTFAVDNEGFNYPRYIARIK